MTPRRPTPKLKRLNLTERHRWTAAPGCKILVLGRGAARIDYPDAWHMQITDDSVELHDRAPPDNDFVFGLSWHRWPLLPQAQIPLAQRVRAAIDGDERKLNVIEPVVEETRIDTQFAWIHAEFIDPATGREACARLAIGRKADVQALLTFDFWRSDQAACKLRWNAILASMQLARWVDDPHKGPVFS